MRSPGYTSRDRDRRKPPRRLRSIYHMSVAGVSRLLEIASAGSDSGSASNLLSGHSDKSLFDKKMIIVEIGASAADHNEDPAIVYRRQVVDRIRLY